MPPRPDREKSFGDVLAAIERYREATQAPCARCPEGAREWQTRIDARKVELIDAVLLYGLSVVG